jgi:hypothetical protein
MILFLALSYSILRLIQDISIHLLKFKDKIQPYVERQRLR